MTDRDPDLSGPDRDELLAIELALGLLEPEPRAEAEQRVRDDPLFAALFRRWEVRVLAMLEGREARPSASVWPAILRRLPANDTARGVRWWQAATALAASVALVLGATLALRPDPAPVVRTSPPARPLVAVLASAERQDVVAVRYDPATRQLSALPTALAADGRQPQLWVIPPGGAPVSLGLLPAGTRTIRAPEARIATLLSPGATLAVSLEPQGGSPTGAPTGPVILTGTIARS